MPSALLRSAPSSNVVVMIESAAGEMIAAPKPCTARAPIRTPSDHARPQKNEATVKITTPVRKTRRRPSRSAARPPRSRKPPNVIAYAVITHWRFDSEKWSDLPIEGSATLTIETSRTVMKKAAQTTASAFQRSGSSSGIRDLPPLPVLPAKRGLRKAIPPAATPPDAEHVLAPLEAERLVEAEGMVVAVGDDHELLGALRSARRPASTTRREAMPRRRCARAVSTAWKRPRPP